MAEDKKILVPNFDNSFLQINSVKLDENNYLAWSMFCLLFNKVRGLQSCHIISNNM